MDPNAKIKVLNTTKHPVFVSFPDLKFSRTWAPGGEYKINFDIIQEGYYDNGFRSFIEEGILFIDDKEARVELGLESEEDEKPALKILTNAQLTKLLKATSIEEFAITAREITLEQCKAMIDMALESMNIDMRKAEILKQITGIDTIKAIELKRQNEETDDE